MPWTCGGCALEIVDSEPSCPQCGAVKAAWTLFGDQTRAFQVVASKRFELWRGSARAQTAPSLAKEEARRLAREGARPPEAALLHVRLFPGKHADWSVKVAVGFETREVVDHELPRRADPGFSGAGHVDVPLLLVRGDPADDPGDIAFEGVAVIDVSEATASGHAPSIEVAALRKRPQTLPIEGGAGARLRLVVDDPDGDPLTVGRWLLRFAGGERRAPLPRSGLIEADLPPGVREAELRVFAREDDPDDDPALCWTLEVEDELPPLDAEAGLQRRLANLGFFPGPIDGEAGSLTAAAVREFQRAHGLSAHGRACAETRAKLQEVYGA